jgi:hypothetical protein
MDNSTLRGRGRSLEQWQALFAEQAASGLSQQAFCQAHGLSTSAFYQAKSRMKTNGAVPMALRPEPAFVAVSVDPSPVMSDRPQDWEVELTLGAGVVLRLRHAVDSG